MKAYRIQNDIVAARDEQEAIAAWAKHYSCEPIAAGPVEEVPLDLVIMIEGETEQYTEGKLSEVMPGDDEPAQVVCTGECDC